MKNTTMLQVSVVSATLCLAACGKGGGDATKDAAAAATDNTTSDPDPSADQLALTPSGQDIASNSQTQAQVATSGMDSAASGAASGLNGTVTTASLALDGSSPLLGLPTAKTASGEISRDCYLGAGIPSRAAGATPSWPESTDAASIFAGSKSDATVAANMAVEPALLQYPTTSPTATLTLSAPYAFANLVEVIHRDNRELQINLNDRAQTAIDQKAAVAEHRFWVASNPITGQTSASMSCSPMAGVAAKGASGTADGTYAHIKWSDNKQVSGLNLLTRFNSTGSRTHSYLPRKKGVYATAPISIDSKFGASGYRLVEWAVSDASASTVTNAAFVRQKTITHVNNRLDQTVDGAQTLLSDLSHKDEIRATDPLLIQSFFDSTEKPLAELIKSGTVYKTGSDASGAVRWFSSMTFANVQYDLVNSTEVCIPIAGTSTLTVYDKEGGTQLAQVTITYSSVAGAAGGSAVDPQISVSGDDADGTRAKWMLLSVNRKCDLK